MKKLIKPLFASSLFLITTGVDAQGYSEEKIEQVIQKMDDNQDQRVGFKEYFADTVTQNDDSYDVNKDGYITSGEVVLEIKEDLIQTIAEMRKQGLSEQAINKTIAQELSTAETEAEALIRKMDADGDNLVEPQELEAYQHQQFNALDKNHDGVISRSDVKTKGFPIRRLY